MGTVGTMDVYSLLALSTRWEAGNDLQPLTDRSVRTIVSCCISRPFPLLLLLLASRFPVDWQVAIALDVESLSRPTPWS